MELTPNIFPLVGAPKENDDAVVVLASVDEAAVVVVLLTPKIFPLADAPKETEEAVVAAGPVALVVLAAKILPSAGAPKTKEGAVFAADSDEEVAAVVLTPKGFVEAGALNENDGVLVMMGSWDAGPVEAFELKLKGFFWAGAVNENADAGGFTLNVLVLGACAPKENDEFEGAANADCCPSVAGEGAN